MFGLVFIPNFAEAKSKTHEQTCALSANVLSFDPEC